MFNSDTTFILGAGASFDFGFPLGSTLKESLCALLRKAVADPQSESQRTLRVKGIEPLTNGLSTALRLADSLEYYDSIDTCLGTFSSEEDKKRLGKLAITLAIADAEKKSKLSKVFTASTYDRATNVKTILKKTWVDTLITILVSGLEKEQANSIFDKVTIINFNYDRSIYLALCYGLASALDITLAESSDLLDSLKYYHPYGSLGELKLEHNGSVAWGLEGADPVETSNGIKVYTEEPDNDHILNLEAQECVAQSSQLVFLGFGFHEQNMRILKPNMSSKRPFPVAKKKVFPTMMEMRGADQRINTELIMNTFDVESLNSLRKRIGDENQDCTAYLLEYGREMSLSGGT